MPRFAPFRGLRYRDPDVSAVVCPPYDVISPAERDDLEARHPLNCVRLELPSEGEGGTNRYLHAQHLLHQWQAAGGPLAPDDQPSLYAYRLSCRDDAGAPATTTGVIGALGLEPPAHGGVLPHERTTPKDKADRLELLQATRANISPIWGLSLAAGLSGLIGPAIAGRPPTSTARVAGVTHELWQLSEPATVAGIVSAVASAPVVVADGHHRFEVALAHAAETGALGGDGPAASVMAFVVELSDEQLSIGPIHRVLSSLPEDLDVADAVASWFSVSEAPPPTVALVPRLLAAGGPLLLTSGGAWQLSATARAKEASAYDLDSSHLDLALAGLPPHTVSYETDWRSAAERVRAGAAQAAFLLRPCTVAQIAAVASAGDRMPPKTTFFTPKPATGMVIRPLWD